MSSEPGAGQFNQFIGFREVQNRIERVEAKLKESDYASPALNRRYSFHTTYREIVLRNRRCQKIDIRNLENYRVLSTLASLKEITRALPAQHIAELKARVLDSLSPDQDVRRFEHELRVFVHYRQAGLSVTPIPTNGLNRFDFLVSTPKGEFEVECKTFSEDIGRAISIEQSLTFFRAIKFVIGSWNDSIESGIFTITLPAKSLPTRNEISSFMKSFLAKSPQTSDYGAFRISFQRKPEWDHYLPTKDFEGVAEEMAAEHQRTNPHAFCMINKDHALMFCLDSEIRPRPLVAIFDRLKEASGQFSKTRPAVIWGHFLAFEEEGFLKLLEPHKSGNDRVIDVFGGYLFRSPNRKHVCRLKLSADGSSLYERRRQMILPYNSKTITSSGRTYELASRVSAFNPDTTEW